MANPVSKGIGTGSAQIFGTSRMDKALGKAFDGINANNEAEEKRRLQKKLQDDKGKKGLRGKYDDLDYSKMMLGDQQTFSDDLTNEMSRFDGHWGEILDNDPKWANEYRKSIAGLKSRINVSSTSRPLADAQLTKMKQYDSGYSQEAIDNFSELKSQPGYNHDEMLQSGVLNRDMIIGSMLGNTDKAFKSDGDELYDYKDAGSRDAQGNVYNVDKKVWKSDDKALPIFKETVEANPSLMQDMNIQYSDLPVEERMGALYQDYKQSRQLDEIKTVNQKAIPKDDGNGGGFGNGKFQFAYREVKRGTRIGSGNKRDRAVITVGKTSGSPLSPITYNNKKGVISELVQDKDGKWMAKFSLVKDTQVNDEWVMSGKADRVPIDGIMESHLESTYGITNLDEFAEQLKAGNTNVKPTEDNPLGLDL